MAKALTSVLRAAARSAISRSKAACRASRCSAALRSMPARVSAVPTLARCRPATNSRWRPRAAPSSARSTFRPSTDGPIRVVMGPQDDEFGDARQLFLDSEWKISATSDRMGYRLEGPVDQASAWPQHRLRRHRERQHPGARQRRADRADAGSRHHRRLSQDRDGDLRPTSAGSRRRRPGAAFVSRPSAWRRRRPRRASSPNCCAPCPTASTMRRILILDIEALQKCQCRRRRRQRVRCRDVANSRAGLAQHPFTTKRTRHHDNRSELRSRRKFRHMGDGQ